MKALVLNGPKDFKLVNDWPAPQPTDDWAVVRVAYAGVCGSDMARFFQTGSYHSPMVIGHEFSGIIEQPAKNGKLPKGTPVAVLPIIPCGVCQGCRETGEPFHCSQYQFIGSRNNGGFAETCLVKESNLFVLDSAARLKQGAFIEPLAVGLHTVRRSGLQKGERKTAAVFGAGPIGLSVAFWLNHFGMDVTVVDVRDYSLAIARKMGLTNTLTFAETAGHRWDALFEASGAPAVLARAIQCAKPKATLTVLGRGAGDTVIPHDAFEMLQRKEITLNGCWGYNLAGEEAVMQDGLAHFDPDWMVSHIVKPEAIVDQLWAMHEHQCDYCKVLLSFQEG